MKRVVLCIAFLLLISAGVVWTQDRDDARPAAKAADEKGGDDESEGAKITHDTNGNVVIAMTDDMQGDAGIVVSKAAAGQWSPEVRGYGRVMDPAPLAALANELSTDEAAYAVSKQELQRLKALSEQANASARALENAQAAALRDQLAIQSVQDRLELSWGNVSGGQSNLTAFVNSLITRKQVLLRIDLPAGQILEASPTGARVVTLSDNTAEAKFLAPAPTIDPQLQGQGFIFSVEPNTLLLASGQAVTGYLTVPGQPISGVVIPRDAIVRTEGAAWVYVMNVGGESFTRKQIPLDRPTDTGWFVSSGITPQDYVVTGGAQTLLSEELKGALKPD
jgi:hypothetical protein